MRSKSEPSGQSRSTFIEEARRRQIIDSAIGLIAERGISQASLAEIAREAGCSKGVISYHFDGKVALIEAILSRLIREPAEFIKQRVDACDRAMDKLKAYVRTNFEFMKLHRNNYVALVDLWGSRGWSEGRNRFNAEAYGPSRSYLGRILELGQERGEFRPLAIKSLASLIQAAIDGVMLQWVYDPEVIDLDTSCNELLEMLSAYVTGAGGRPNGPGPLITEGELA